MTIKQKSVAINGAGIAFVDLALQARCGCGLVQRPGEEAVNAQAGCED